MEKDDEPITQLASDCCVVLCVDIAGTSVEQCEVRYKEMVERTRKERHQSQIFQADEFITADCSKVGITHRRCSEPCLNWHLEKNLH